MDIQEELLKRYVYLNENKELILSNCIIYDIEKKYLKKQLKNVKYNLKKLKKSNCDQNLIDLLNSFVDLYKEELHTYKPYLSSKASPAFVDMIEEFVLGDKKIEETELYNLIEEIKTDKDSLYVVNHSINELEERRSKNQHLKNIPTFTVWKILSYVRKKYENNATVLAALDKYYNLDRFVLANDDSKYGYYIPEDVEYSLDGYPNSSIISKSSIDCIIFNYQGNEFEEEDKYHDYLFDKKLTEKGYSTKFGNYLVNLKMIENKKEKLDKISKSRTLTTINK